MSRPTSNRGDLNFLILGTRVGNGTAIRLFLSLAMAFCLAAAGRNAILAAATSLDVVATAPLSATATKATSIFNGSKVNNGSSSEIPVHMVHLVFSHHLDVGLDLPLKLVTNCVGFATTITQRYFDEYIPRALRLAQASREPTAVSLHGSTSASTSDRFVYQVHSWIASLYVDCVAWSVADGCRDSPAQITCPSPEEVAQFGRALVRGDIVLTDSPFNLNAEAAGDPGIIGDVATISKSLLSRFNATSPGATVWSGVDVPGFARTALPALARAEVTALYVGRNGGPEPEAVARTRGIQPIVGAANATIFRWRDPASNTELPVVYHDGYGGYASRDTCVVSPNGVALASYYRSDNAGPPQTLAEIRGVFDQVRRIFPNATVRASSISSWAAEALTPAVVAQLPVTTRDWGDAWITGVSTDPWRLAFARSITRARAAHLAAGGLCRASRSAMTTRFSALSTALANATRFLIKASEHTQGVQGELWSPGIAGPLEKEHADRTHWSNAQFQEVHNAAHNKFNMGELSWIEARAFPALALEALRAGASAGDACAAAIAAEVDHDLVQLYPSIPQLSKSMRTLSVNEAVTGGNGIVLAIGSDGGLSRFITSDGTEWLGGGGSGSIDHLEGRTLLGLRYKTFNASEQRWDPRQNMTCAQPGCANPESRVWTPSLTGLWTDCAPELCRQKNNMSSSGAVLCGTASCRTVAKLTLPVEAHTKYGAPSTAYLDIHIEGDGINATLTWINKTATRLPESIMLHFEPRLPGRPASRTVHKHSSSSRGGEFTGGNNNNNNSSNNNNSNINSSPLTYGIDLDVLGGWVSPEEVHPGGTNQFQRALWRGFRFAPRTPKGRRAPRNRSGASAVPQAQLMVETLDAALGCPIIPHLGFLGNATVSGEGWPQTELVYSDITGVAMNLYNNLMPISGFPQWYPFGTGDKYQQRDEGSVFRFRLH